MKKLPSDKQEIGLFSMSNNIITDQYLIDSIVFSNMEESTTSKIGFMITKGNKVTSIKVKLFRSLINNPRDQEFINPSEHPMDKML